jgi:hypothetical protein
MEFAALVSRGGKNDFVFALCTGAWGCEPLRWESVYAKKKRRRPGKRNLHGRRAKRPASGFSMLPSLRPWGMGDRWGAGRVAVDEGRCYEAEGAMGGSATSPWHIEQAVGGRWRLSTTMMARIGPEPSSCASPARLLLTRESASR